MKLENHFQGPMIDHIRDLVAVEDNVLQEARRRAHQAGLPPIEIAPEDGALLAALVKVIDARLVVEIGTLFGYSAIWMARALPDGGQLFTIEQEARHAEVARRNLALAGLTERVTLLEGAADEMLARLAGPVDLVFIDADKEGYPGYLAWARQALRPGGLVLGDNAFMQGRLADPGNEDPGVAAMRRFLESLASDSAWVSAMIPTLEGMALGVRT
jgi:predicted O-methyltransferase YrrM